MKAQFLAIGIALLVASCGEADKSSAGAGSAASTGVKVPDQFRGTWSSDCAKPFVTFADGAVTLFPVTKPYELRAAEVQGTDFLVSYVSPDVPGTIKETYRIEGETLRLTTTTVDGKVVGTWNKRPMTKCSDS